MSQFNCFHFPLHSAAWHQDALTKVKWKRGMGQRSAWTFLHGSCCSPGEIVPSFYSRNLNHRDSEAQNPTIKTSPTHGPNDLENCSIHLLI